MRTDLAHESEPKPEGNFVTLFCEEFDAPRDIAALTESLHSVLNEALKDGNIADKKILVAGLGNENITPDSLGVRTVGKVLATGHFATAPEIRGEFDELGLREVYVIAPGVMAQTGFETARQLRFVADGLAPDCLIVVDSLACNSAARLAKTIQLTDTGISPGSGVGNNRCEISQKLFGIPVIAIGIPTVIDLECLTEKSPSDDKTGAPCMVVPRNIDVVVNHFARVISAAINRVLNPGLDESEIENLMMFA
jgi:spore protease